MAQSPTSRNKAKARTATAPEPVATVSMASLLALDAIKVDLQAVAAKLMDSEPALGAPNRAEWEAQIDKVDLAIARAKLAHLKAVSSAFDQDVADLKDATGKLAETLKQLQKVSAVIDAVAGALGVLEKIIAIGR